MATYKYGDRVKAIAGFYLNLEGDVVDYKPRTKPIQYEVTFELPGATFPTPGAVTAFVDEPDLQLVRSR